MSVAALILTSAALAGPGKSAGRPVEADTGEPFIVGSIQQPEGVTEFSQLLQGSDASGQAGIINLRLGDRGAETRFVAELSRDLPAQYQVFTLANPWRVVIDVKNTPFALGDNTASHALGLVTAYRFGRYQNDISRIVIETRSPVTVTRNFVLEPQGGFGRRIVLDMAATDDATFLRTAQAADMPVNPAVPPQAAPVAALSVPLAPPYSRPADRHVVVIDAGHGGVDPGTHSRNGIDEKNVVLAFAKAFAKKLRATGRYDVYLTRDDDTFIPLRQRVAIARQHKADLFISIHADSIQKSDVRGMSIYTLSETASDKEAAALAAKENQSDLIAGVDLQGESPEVTGILIDLAQRETKNYSARFARSVVDYASRTTTLLDPAHRFAGFVVLKAPDVPSVLVELGFLTNRNDEKQITSSKWRSNTADAFTRAVDRYFGERMAEGPR
ncbi:MAG: N-acetylmuramoyl-L-alanine amidase [Parvibaculum sp.]